MVATDPLTLIVTMQNTRNSRHTNLKDRVDDCAKATAKQQDLTASLAESSARNDKGDEEDRQIILQLTGIEMAKQEQGAMNIHQDDKTAAQDGKSAATETESKSAATETDSKPAATETEGK